jgi:hypothetical protein
MNFGTKNQITALVLGCLQVNLRTMVTLNLGLHLSMDAKRIMNLEVIRHRRRKLV